MLCGGLASGGWASGSWGSGYSDDADSSQIGPQVLQALSSQLIPPETNVAPPSADERPCRQLSPEEVRTNEQREENGEERAVQQ